MTLTQRIATCQSLIDGYRAEKIGLIQAELNRALSRDAFSSDVEWIGYCRGWDEGRAILEKGEGR